jgi:hypothetical protein
VLQRDYILRMVEQLVQALARIAGRRRQGEEARFEQELDDFSKSSFGMPLDLIAGLPDDELMKLLVRDRLPDHDRIALLARVLWERCRLDAGGGATSPRARKSLRLLAAVGRRTDPRSMEAHREAFVALVATFEKAPPSPTILHDLWLSCEALGLYARAEDKLYALDALEPLVHAAPGEAFYRRLLEHDDDTLEAGGLPRDEVEDGLTRWIERSRRHG